jgi:hypothetical protein
VVAQDLITAFLETSKMNHYFRVFEILALRIKRPAAICTIEGQGPAGEVRQRRPERASAG